MCFLGFVLTWYLLRPKESFTQILLRHLNTKVGDSSPCNVGPGPCRTFATKFEFWIWEYSFILSTQDRVLGFMIPLAASGQKIQVQIVKHQKILFLYHCSQRCSSTVQRWSTWDTDGWNAGWTTLALARFLSTSSQEIALQNRRRWWWTTSVLGIITFVENRSAGLQKSCWCLGF